ncbi:MAG: homocysteine S-methyltransferase family protein [Bacteroidota bacterium]
MSRILAKLETGRILVSDGGWGTFLHKKGLAVGDCPEIWNIEKRSEVLEIAKAYVAAGSDLIETNSFGGTSIKLKHYGLDKRAYELNKAAAEISNEAAGNDVFVLGSIGPTGKFIMMGDVTEAELYESFAEQSKALADGGADAICIETFYAIDEALIALKAAKENTNLEVIITFTFDMVLEGKYNTMMGVSPAQMTQELVNAGADIIGTNCGNGFEGMINIVKEIRSANNNIPILVHANAGLPIIEDGKTLFPDSPELMASLTNKIISAGANIIGGCCGTTPDHISRIKGVVDIYNNSLITK